MNHIPNMASSEEEGDFETNNQIERFWDVELFRQGGLFLVFDIRQKSSPVPPMMLDYFGQRINADYSTEIISLVAAKYKVLETKISFYEKERMAVIKDDDALYHLFCRYEMDHVQQAHCIAIDPEKSVAFLETQLSLGRKRDIALFRCSNGIKHLAEKEKIRSELMCGDTIRCIENAPRKIQFHYLSTEDAELVFTITTRPVVRIRDIKHILEKKCRVKTEDIWLTRGTSLMENDDFLFLHLYLPSSLKLSRIVLHIESAESLPVKVKIEGESFLILVSLPVEAVHLRKKISRHVKKAPEMLKLFVKDRRLREEVLTAEKGLVKGCTITVRLTRKIPIHICLPNNSHSMQELWVYKLDLISDVKNSLCESLDIPTHQIELFFSGVRMEDDKTLSDYRVHSEDILQLLILKEPISLQVHVPSVHGWDKLWVTADEHRQCTIRDLKEYLSREHKIGRSYLFFEGRFLEEDLSLEECKLRTGSSIVVQKSSTDGCYSCGAKVQPVYSVDCDGTSSPLLACGVGGVMFYAPASTDPEMLQTVFHQLEDERQNTKAQQIFTVGSALLEDRPVSSQRNNNKQTNELGSAVDELTQPSIRKRDPCLSTFTYLQERNLQHVNDEHQETGSLSEVSLNGNGNDEVVKMFSCVVMKRGDGCKTRTAAYMERNVPAERADDVFMKDMTAFSDAMSSDTDQLSGKEPLPKSSSQFCFPNNVVSDADLQNVASRIGSDWQVVAVRLGLEHHTIQNILHRDQSNLVHQAMNALTQWRKKYSKDATPEKLKEVLRQCELNIIADSLGNNEDSKSSPT